MTHASSLISGLRSVAFNVPDLALAEDFYTRVWGLSVAAREAGALYLRATGADHHVLALHQQEGPAQIRHVTLRARSLQALQQAAAAVQSAGGRVVQPLAELRSPGGGTAVSIADPDGRVFQLVFGDALHTDTSVQPDAPIRLAHAVLNSHDVEASRVFLEQVLDFSLSDRTRIMAFMRCNSDHHSIALGDTDNDALNHVAFVVADTEAVMRGGGRMKDAGFGIEWGPGRHGPGNNVFNYFVGPFDIVIEYTSDVQQIDDSYRAGQPGDWTWPPGRIDQWGISAPPSAALKVAQRAVMFAPT
jgi:catechol 2,3-dioxygenase